MSALDDLNKLLDRIPLWKRIQQLPDKLDKIEARVKAIEDRISGTGDVCPYCRQAKGQLLVIRDDKTFGDAGVKRYFFKCSACGKEYDHEVAPKTP